MVDRPIRYDEGQALSMLRDGYGVDDVNIKARVSYMRIAMVIRRYEPARMEPWARLADRRSREMIEIENRNRRKKPDA